MTKLKKILPEYLEKAKSILTNRERIDDLLKNASEKLTAISGNSAKMQEFVNNLKIFIQMVRESFSGTLQFSWQSVVLITAGLIYFVTPVDLLPDFVPVLGFTDDITVILFISKSISEDVERYKEQFNDTVEQA